MAWARTAANETGSLVFIDHVTADGCCVKNSERNIQDNLLGSNQIPQSSMDGALPCSRTKTPNILWKQPKSFQVQKWNEFLTGSVNGPYWIRLNSWRQKQTESDNGDSVGPAELHEGRYAASCSVHGSQTTGSHRTPRMCSKELNAATLFQVMLIWPMSFVPLKWGTKHCSPMYKDCCSAYADNPIWT